MLRTPFRRRIALVNVATACLMGLALGQANATASSDTSLKPYLSTSVPVAKGCIVLDQEWAGNKVYLVQRRLGAMGDRDRYLQDTTDAVRHFQRRQGLAATGRVNRTTWDALGMKRPFCMDRFTVQPTVQPPTSTAARIHAMIAWARSQLGRRYIWGGAGPIGYDCSGLALQAMHAGGRVLPTVTTWLHQRQDFATATQIYRSGLRRAPLAERQRGDLVFYGPVGSMTHMAIYLGHNTVIEAVRPVVRISRLRDHGVPLKPRVARPFGR